MSAATSSDSDAQQSHGGRVPWWQAIGAGLVFGALMALSLPPVGLWPATLFAVLPLAWLGWRIGLCDGCHLKRTALWASLGTVPMWLVEEHWIMDISAAGYAPLALMMSIYPGLFVWLIARIGRGRNRLPVGRLPMGIVVPIAWVGIEFLRGRIVLDGYPWYLIAHPLIDAPVLAAPAAIAGVYFVGLLTSAWAGILLDALAGRRKTAAAESVIVLAVWAGTSAWASAIPADPQGEPVRIGVVQTNVPQDNKMGWSLDQRAADFERFGALSRELAAHQPDLIVWPETMYPGYFLDPESLATVNDQRDRLGSFGRTVEGFAEAFAQLRAEVAVPVLVGSGTYEGLTFTVDADRLTWTGERNYNSALLIEAEQVARYDKMFLTPFGEVMPYISKWPWLEQRLLSFGASGMMFDLDANDEAAVLTTASGLAIATPICFEATIPWVCRRLVFEGGSRRAAIMINLTNDGWFGTNDMGRRRHLLIARWRCVELATPMVRAANTGISCLIDRRGRVIKTLGPRTQGTLMVEVTPASGTTVFARIGDLVGWFSLGGAILLAVGSYRGKRMIEDGQRGSDR